MDEINLLRNDPSILDAASVQDVGQGSVEVHCVSLIL